MVRPKTLSLRARSILEGLSVSVPCLCFAFFVLSMKHGLHVQCNTYMCQFTYKNENLRI